MEAAPKQFNNVRFDDPCPCGNGRAYSDCCLTRGPDAYGNRIQSQTVPVIVEGSRAEVLSSFIWRGKRFRIVWNRLYWFDSARTFPEFLNYLATVTLGRHWFSRQEELPESERHAIVQWRHGLFDLIRRPPDTPDGGWNITGPAQAYLSLAYDLYWLQINNKLPKSLRRRLRDREAFQGARYEILIAATFARAGFEIELLDESVKSTKHCEFIATHKRTGRVVYVEAKSRHRRGVLHQSGTFNEVTDMRGGILGLYRDAVKQAPKGHPYLIFIDVNLPIRHTESRAVSRDLGLDELPWVRGIFEELTAERVRQRSTPQAAVFITDFAPHFGNNAEAAPPAMFFWFPSPKPAIPLTDPAVLDDLVHCLNYYGRIPRQF